MSRTLVHLMSLMRSTEALALVGSQGPEIRDLGRIDRDLECGVGLLEYSSASLSLEEEASRTSDLARRLQFRAYRPNLIDLAREPLPLVRNGAAKTQIVVQIRGRVLMADATGRPYVCVVPCAATHCADGT
mgnify:CR=1 FL=1